MIFMITTSLYTDFAQVDAKLKELVEKSFGASCVKYAFDHSRGKRMLAFETDNEKLNLEDVKSKVIVVMNDSDVEVTKLK